MGAPVVLGLVGLAAGGGCLLLGFAIGRRYAKWQRQKGWEAGYRKGWQVGRVGLARELVAGTRSADGFDITVSSRVLYAIIRGEGE